MKDDYKKENPDIKLMGDKFIGPKKQIENTSKRLYTPLPKPKDARCNR